MRRVRVRIDGRVQGVFFRASCRRLADDLGIAGWIRNAPDGAVEAAFEGEDAAVQKLLEWCRHGPSGARVASVEVTEEPPSGAPGFRVVR
jgi:acylphosphatase